VLKSSEPSTIIDLVVSRPDGKLAYETWVKKVGHADVAVAWEKLSKNVQAIWAAVAEACDRQTMAFLASEKKRLEAFQASRPGPMKQASRVPAAVVTTGRQKP
jgi:hypothetical protein